MRFLQERCQKYIQNELLESIRQTISLACSVLRGRAHNVRLQGGDVRAKITFNHMTAEVPETRLVKLLIIALIEKYTDEETLCWSNIYCLLQKSNSVTTNLI